MRRSYEGSMLKSSVEAGCSVALRYARVLHIDAYVHCFAEKGGMPNVQKLWCVSGVLFDPRMTLPGV